MKNKLLFLLIFLSVSHIHAQRTLIDSTYTETIDKYGEYISRAKEIYKRSPDNMTDSIRVYWIYPNYFYQKGVELNEYYPDGKIKNETRWENGSSFDFRNANVDYQYFYTIDGKLEQQNTMFVHNGVRQPLFNEKYYYGVNGLDSIIRKKYNTSTKEFYKDLIRSYTYLESGNYEIIESNYIPELQEFRKEHKTLYILDNNGRIVKTRYYNFNSGEWRDSNFYYEYEYTDTTKISTQTEYGIPRDKVVESFDKNGNMTRRCLYFWNSNQKYWSLNSDSKIIYFYNSVNNNIFNYLVNDFIIYPNPFLNNIYIKAENYIRCKIYDNAGKLIIQTKNVEVNTSFLKSGIYIAVITTKNGDIYHKIIKK